MEIIQETLSNGTTILLAPRAGTEAVTAMVMVRAGSYHEAAEESGMAHFIEHTLFKGTPTRPNAFTITKELDGLGADYNAATSYEYTTYYATVRKNHLRDALSILSDMYLNATFPEGELEKEKGVVIEEIKMYADDPQSAVHLKHTAQVFGDQPAGRSIAGSIDTVRAFTRDQVVAVKNRWYVGANTVVIITGAIDIEEARQLARDNFADLPAGESVQVPKLQDALPAEVLVETRQSDQAHVVMSLPGLAISSEDRRAASLLAKLLGGTMSSRLFQTLREELGLAYYVGASLSSRRDFGRFIIYAGTDVARTEEALSRIQQLVTGVAQKGIEAEELVRARESMLGAFALGLESSESVAMFLAKEWLYFDDIKTPNERVQDIMAVTQADIERIARELLQHDFHVTVLGPESISQAGILAAMRA